MESFRKQNGVSFLLVNFVAKNEMFLLPSEVLAEYKKAADSGGRKSIPYSDFNPALIVRNEGGFPVHYLVAVNAYLNSA
jgi:recombination protein U